MPGNRSIAVKLILVITVCSALIFTVTIGYFYYSSREVLEKELERNARNLALASVTGWKRSFPRTGRLRKGWPARWRPATTPRRNFYTLITGPQWRIIRRFTVPAWPSSPTPSTPHHACMLHISTGKTERSPSSAWKGYEFVPVSHPGLVPDTARSWGRWSGASRTSTKAGAISP